MNKVLAQDEVDALLRGLTGGEIDTAKDETEDEGDIVAFDLANQDRIIRGRMPVLEIVNDRFARLCTNALSNAVRKRVELNPISIDMTKFGEFIRSLPVPTSINIFKMDPLRGNAIMVVDSRLVFALVENIFGGSGSQPKIEGREFTRIEQAVVDHIVKLALENMEESWRPVHDVKLELVRSEINPQFAAIVPPSDVVVVITFEVELDTALGSMIVCLPYATIEPIRSKLHASFQTERLEVDHAWVARLKERLMETPVELKVHFGSTTITGNQLLRMQVGDVLVLDRVADPGNVGTLIRTAEAAGMAGVVLLAGCADAYAPKTVRSTMGSLLRVPVLADVTEADFITWAKENGYEIMVTCLDGAQDLYKTAFAPRTAIVVGSEAYGASKALKAAATKRVFIPMQG